MKKKTAPQNTQKRVREAIADELKKVTATAYPNLYERIRTQAGYMEVEATIIDMMIRTGISPAACVTNLETETLT